MTISSIFALRLIRSYPRVAGVDEVGYGSLAGPVVAACVRLPEKVLQYLPESLMDVDDSKKLTPLTRGRLSGAIQEVADAVGIGCVEASVIDSEGLRPATNLAILQAIDDCTNGRPDLILLDGNYRPTNLMVPVRTIVKGDQTEILIAAASIVAKYYRDNLMYKLHQKYPDYGFDHHNGYGTPKHIDRIKTLGPIPGVHRATFIRRIMEET